MDWLTDWLIGFASDRNHPAGLALLAGAACFEYLFPPIPGDTITLFGAVLISGFGWSLPGVLAMILVGSFGGAASTFAIGRRMRARGHRRPRIDKVVARFERHGPAYLLVNRFIPGVRAVAFIAAGMSGMRGRDVILYGGTSVVLWNSLLIGIGSAVGANWETLEGWLRGYNTWVWAVLGSVAVLIIGWRLVRRWRRGKPPVE